MINVEEIIGNLLLRHNCVIIPGFGGFVAKQNSARIDYKNGVLSPPSKSLLFNRQLINNDGLLISEFALQNSIPYEESVSTVNQLVTKWNLELSAGNRISIDKVGFLFFDQERNICFEQDRYFNLLLSSYGLGSVHFLTETDVAIAKKKTDSVETLVENSIFIAEENKKIKSVEAEPIIVSLKEKETIVEGKSAIVIRKKSNFWKYAAAACMAPILFYSLWIPMKTDVLESKIISFQDFNPFHKQEKAVYGQTSISELIPNKQEENLSLKEQLNTVESNADTYSYNLTDETYVLVKIERTKSEQNTDAQPQPISVESSTSRNHQSFNYIVGCFSDETNANNLVKDLKSKGFNAFIKDKKGNLTRVSIGSTDSADELNQLISKATAAGFTGWVLKQ